MAENVGATAIVLTAASVACETDRKRPHFGEHPCYLSLLHTYML